MSKTNTLVINGTKPLNLKKPLVTRGRLTADDMDAASTRAKAGKKAIGAARREAKQDVRVALATLNGQLDAVMGLPKAAFLDLYRSNKRTR